MVSSNHYIIYQKYILYWKIPRQLTSFDQINNVSVHVTATAHAGSIQRLRIMSLPFTNAVTQLLRISLNNVSEWWDYNQNVHYTQSMTLINWNYTHHTIRDTVTQSLGVTLIRVLLYDQACNKFQNKNMHQRPATNSLSYTCLLTHSVLWYS